jgi:hypothetical protein
MADLKHMYQHNLVTGMKIQSHASPDPICEPCILGKQKCHNIPKTASRKTSLLALVHTDLKGPLPVHTREGHCYWQCFTDDKSRYKVVAFLKHKSDALEALSSSKHMLRTRLTTDQNDQR